MIGDPPFNVQPKEKLLLAIGEDDHEKTESTRERWSQLIGQCPMLCACRQTAELLKEKSKTCLEGSIHFRALASLHLVDG